MACTVTPEGPAPPARAGLPGRRLGGVLPPRVGPKGVQVWKAVWSEGSALRGPVGWGGGHFVWALGSLCLMPSPALEGARSSHTGRR